MQSGDSVLIFRAAVLWRIIGGFLPVTLPPGQNFLVCWRDDAYMRPSIGVYTWGKAYWVDLDLSPKSRNSGGRQRDAAHDWGAEEFEGGFPPTTAPVALAWPRRTGARGSSWPAVGLRHMCVCEYGSSSISLGSSITYHLISFAGSCVVGACWYNIFRCGWWLRGRVAWPISVARVVCIVGPSFQSVWDEACLASPGIIHHRSIAHISTATHSDLKLMLACVVMPVRAAGMDG